MWPVREQPGSQIGYALAGAAIIGAQYIAAKAARDALFLTYYEPSSLPPMIIGTSIFSIVLVVLSSKGLGGVPPATYVPLAFLGSAALLGVEWALTFAAPRLAAPVLYLQVSGIGPLLGSGFWLIASERFDPRTARKRFGQIGGAGTLGGLAGGLVAARLAAAADVVALLPLLAGLNAICALLARSLARTPRGTAPLHGHRRPPPAPTIRPGSSGLRILARTSYLRDLAILVLVGTIAAAFVDYVFKVQVKAAFAGGAELGTFFSAYYAGVNLITFAIQAFGSYAVLEKLGLAAAMGAPSLCFVAGGAAALAFPGLPSVVTARAAESVCRGSLLRSGYELFYTPIAPDDKRRRRTCRASCSGWRSCVRRPPCGWLRA
jgi:hypothetical protein